MLTQLLTMTTTHKFPSLGAVRRLDDLPRDVGGNKIFGGRVLLGGGQLCEGAAGHGDGVAGSRLQYVDTALNKISIMIPQENNINYRPEQNQYYDTTGNIKYRPEQNQHYDTTVK